MYPRMVNIDPHSLYFSCIYPQIWQTTVLNNACPCLAIYRVGRYGFAACAQKIWSFLTRTVLYYRAPMQVKNILKFNEFSSLPSGCDWPAKGQTLVTTQDCSPTQYEYVLKYSDLHLEYFWRTSCYMYPPPPPPPRMVNIDPHSLYFSCIYPQVWQTSVATVCMPMSSQLQGRWVRVCSVRTKDMELLSLSVLYIQGSDAGQK